MKISAKTQYACTAMIELASNYAKDQLIRIKSISDAHSISSRFLVQILLQLKTAGLVTSARGATGGYQLARPPEEITLADILNAIEDRNGEQQPNEQSAVCQILGEVWSDVHEEEQRILREHTLASLVHRVHDSNALSYHI